MMVRDRVGGELDPSDEREGAVNGGQMEEGKERGQIDFRLDDEFAQGVLDFASLICTCDFDRVSFTLSPQLDADDLIT